MDRRQLGRVAGGVFALVTLTHCGGAPDGADGEREAARAEQGLTASTTFGAVADARVEAGSPTANFGAASTLGADLSPQAESLLRFNVTGLSGTVTRVTLRLYVTDGSSDGPRLLRTVGGWSESTVTWNNRPAPVGSALGDKGAVSAGTWMEYDVTSAVQGNGEQNFVLVATSGDGTDVASRQAGTTAQRPQLVVTTTQSETGAVQGAWQLPQALGHEAGMLSLDPGTQDLFVTADDSVDGTHGTWLSRVSSSGAVRWSHRFSPGPHPASPDFSRCEVRVAADTKGGVYLSLAAYHVPCDYRGRTFPAGTTWLAHADGQGSLVALRQLDAPGDTTVLVLAVNPSGNVVVGGYFIGTTDLGAGPLTSPDDHPLVGTAGYVVEYGPDLQLRWARKFDTAGGYDAVRAIAAGPGGEVLLGMSVAGAATLAGQPIPGSGDREVAAMMNPDGTVRWMRAVGSGDWEFAHVSSLGTAVLGVRQWETQYTRVWTLERDAAVRWIRDFSVSFGASAIGADGALRLYVEGATQADFGDGVLRGDGQHGHLVKLGLDGNVRWVQELPGTSTDPVSANHARMSLAASSSGQTFALSSYLDPQRFGDVAVPPSTTEGVYLLRLAP